MPQCAGYPDERAFVRKKQLWCVAEDSGPSQSGVLVRGNCVTIRGNHSTTHVAEEMHISTARGHA